MKSYSFSYDSICRLLNTLAYLDIKAAGFQIIKDHHIDDFIDRVRPELRIKEP